MTKPVMPAFVFARRPDIEHQDGFFLAGILVVDLPKTAEENKRNTRLVEKIVQELADRARSGVLGNELTVGWDGRHKPQNAVNQYDDPVLEAWARSCLKMTVCIGPRADGADGLYPWVGMTAPDDSEMAAGGMQLKFAGRNNTFNGTYLLH
jgi:hypothetical protein